MTSTPGSATFFEPGIGAACCIDAGDRMRSSARRALSGRADAPETVRTRARELAANAVATGGAPGRVTSSGSFSDQALLDLLTRALPAALAGSLRPGFEWYQCRGAHFHSDAHFSNVLFGAWCLAGPPRELVFARSGLRLPAGPGDWVVFDPFEPHAVLDRGGRRYERAQYETAAASVFAGFELSIDASTAGLFGIEPVASAFQPLLSSRIAINAETGSPS